MTDKEMFLEECKKGSPDEVERLLALRKFFIFKRINVNGRTKDDWTPLHGASREGHEDIVKLLISKGATVNATEKFSGKAPPYKVDVTIKRSLNYPMDIFQNRPIGFSFQYPQGWEETFKGGSLVFIPANATTSYLAITMIASAKEVFSKSPAKECDGLVATQPNNFRDYRLLWKRPFNPSSGHTAIEYSFDFTDPRGPFRSIAVVAARQDNLARLFSLDVSGSRSDVESSEETLCKIVRSLSL